MLRRLVRRAIRRLSRNAVTADGMSSARYRYASASREDQLGYIRAAFERGTLSRLDGSLVEDFESSVASYTGARRAVAVSSGTAAIQLAFASFGVKPGDEIVVPEFSWVSVGGAAAAVGAKVVVAPCRRGLAPCWLDIEPLVRPTTAAVVVAHMRGVPALDIGSIADQLRARGIPLLEDCSQAWGVRLDGRHVGRYGNAGVFSTQEYKLVATGEGGFVISDDDELTDAVSRAAGNATTSVVGDWAGNARMTELQAAVGLPQLERLENLIERLVALQSAMLECLARADGVEQVVPVEAEIAARRGRSNGTWVGLWARDAVTARHLATRLRTAGLAASVVGGTDRHWSEAWPVRVREPLVDARQWVELPVPDIPSRHRDTVLHALATAVGVRLPARTQPSRKHSIGLAVVGCGVASSQYLPTLLESGVPIVACVDSDETRADELAARSGGRRATLHDMLCNPQVTAVLNLTPPTLHALITRASLEAHKAVYSEKPLATSAEDAAALVAFAEQEGVALACGPETALDPRWAQLTKVIEDGRIGEPTGAQVNLASNPVAWHPRPEFFYRPGGGPLWDLGPYGLTALILLFGPIARVFARARHDPPPSRSSPPDPPAVPTEVTVLVDLHAGQSATMTLTYGRDVIVAPPLTVFGTQGIVRFSGSGLDCNGELFMRRRSGAWTTIPTHDEPRMNGRGLGVIEFLDALSTGRPPRASATVGLRVVETIEAIERSARSAQPMIVLASPARPEPEAD